MAGLETLIDAVYHEKQQPGSMLCAQHALNSLLQGNYYTAPDLSAIARSLDELEQSVNGAQGNESTNMDDTGFFSLQVLEQALHVWGLNLLRWRSEAMQPYQDHPHTQLAFILNLEQHWFTLRRFGPASKNPDDDQGRGHWFNLNSFLPAPEWVGRLYLSMVLHQAEQEGYSVFVVTQLDPNAPLALPRTDADELAATLPEPSSSGTGTQLSTSRTPPTAGIPASAPPVAGFEDEDMELQAVLQASLAGGSAAELVLPPGFSASFGNTGPRTSIQTRMPGGLEEDPDEEATGMSDGMVAASMARNRAMFERMRREQEMALRDTYDEEVARVEAMARAPRRSRRQAGPPADEDEDEDELVRQAIERSRAPQPEDDDDDPEDLDYVFAEEPSSIPTLNPAQRAPTQDLAAAHQVYDDDDAELQAALKASMETVPEGFRVPSPTPLPAHSAPVPPAPAIAPSIPSEPSAREDEDTASEADSAMDSSVVAESESEPAAAVDHDEMRRRRLARFGGA